MTNRKILSQDALLYRCEHSSRYHQARWQFYNTMHLGIQFAIFAFAIFNGQQVLNGTFGSFGLIWAGGISILALASFVYNPAEKISVHRSLYQRFTMLNGDIASTIDADEAKRAAWSNAIYSLYATEPPVYHALFAHCDNQVYIAMGVEKEYFVNLRWYHRLLRNWISFQSADLRLRNTSPSA